MWPDSYSRCAVCIVRRAVKPSLRAASCCTVEVVNGGGGLRRFGRRSTFSTVSTPLAAARIVRSTSRASPSLVMENVDFCVSASTFSPRYSVSRAGNFALSFDASASTVQYSWRMEVLDLRFALADEAQRDALHAARGQAGLDLLPQQRRQVEPDQVVERAPRLVGVDEVVVHALLGLRDGLAHRVLRDLVEADADARPCRRARRARAGSRTGARKSPRPRGPGRSRGRGRPPSSSRARLRRPSGGSSR